MKQTIDEFEIDLRGLNVLTELATGPFAVTPVLAALAGADSVTAVGADSQYGTYDDSRSEVIELARQGGVDQLLNFSYRAALSAGGPFNIVTNLGHVRPIDATVLSAMARPGCVALMWEPWEFRPSEVDLRECLSRQIPVIGTNESHDRVDTGSFVGLLAVRLLLDVNVAIRQTNVIVVGTSQFTQPIKRTLSDLGSNVLSIAVADLTAHQLRLVQLGSWDAVIVAHHIPELAGTDRRLIALVQAAAMAGLPIINISGLSSEMTLEGTPPPRVHPGLARAQGHMAVTTGALGDRPVVLLHAGGLRAAQDVCRAMQSGRTTEEAVDVAVRGGFGLAMPTLEGCT